VLGERAMPTLLKLLEDYVDKYLEIFVKSYNECIKSCKRCKESKCVERALEDARLEAKNELVRSIYGFCGKVDLARKLVDEAINGLRMLGYEVLVVDARLRSRGVFGSSSGMLATVFEVGISWDHVIDLPFIPGSSVKGAMRSTALLFCARLEKNRRIECVRNVLELFGFIEHPPRDVREDLARVSGVSEVEVEDLLRSVRVGAGSLIVGDAYPIECPNKGILEPTVITPHYRDAEDEYGAMPTPILHLVVRKDAKFRFYVAMGSKAINVADRLCRLLGLKTSPRSFVASILVASLQNGLGARTARGYGVFEVEQFAVKRR